MENIISPTPRKGIVKTNLQPPWDEIEVHTPTIKDRLRAYSLAKSISYQEVPEEYRLGEFTRVLIYTMIDKPKITFEEWLNLDDTAVNVICTKVAEWWNKEIEVFVRELDFLRPKSQTLAT